MKNIDFNFFWVNKLNTNEIEGQEKSMKKVLFVYDGTIPNVTALIDLLGRPNDIYLCGYFHDSLLERFEVMKEMASYLTDYWGNSLTLGKKLHYTDNLESVVQISKKYHCDKIVKRCSDDADKTIMDEYLDRLAERLTSFIFNTPDGSSKVIWSLCDYRCCDEIFCGFCDEEDNCTYCEPIKEKVHQILFLEKDSNF